MNNSIFNELETIMSDFYSASDELIDKVKQTRSKLTTLTILAESDISQLVNEEINSRKA